MMSNGLHEMGLAETDTAVNKQGVVGAAGVDTHLIGGGPSQLIALPLDEVLEREIRIEPAAYGPDLAHQPSLRLAESFRPSGLDRGNPVTFAVNQVIPGWTEALQLMKEGDKWQLFIPAKLAYGERGAGGKIGPNSALLFDVELLSIEKPAADSKQPKFCPPVKWLPDFME